MIAKTSMAPSSDLPVHRIQASFVYDTSSLQEEAGICDYVFLATVIHNDGVEYKNTVITEDENGAPRETGSPYTHYTLQVLENWKGQLITEEEIPVMKHGGLSQDNDSIFLFEDDQLPEEGETYLFFGYAQKDGNILISGPNSNLPLPDSDSRSMDNSYEQYREAVENEIIPVDRERFVSDYDAAKS